MKRSLFVIFFLPAMLISSFAPFMKEAQAFTYYVSPSGSDSNNGSSGSPFATLQHAADKVKAGDTVIVENGVYKSYSHILLRVSRGGTSSAPITFESKNKWGAVLDGRNFATGFGIFFESGVNFVNIKGFDIRDFYWAGISDNTNASNLYFYGNHIHNIGNVYLKNGGSSGMAGIGLGEHGVSNVTIDSSIINNIGRTGPSGNQIYDHGIYLASNSNITIINNVFYNNTSGWDIQVYADTGAACNIYIVSNTFAFPCNFKYPGQIIIDIPIRGTFLIENNIFYQPKGDPINWENGDSGILSLNNNLTTAMNMGVTGRASNLGNILNAAPLFADARSGFFCLATGSPPIGYGILWPDRSYGANGVFKGIIQNGYHRN